MHNHKVRVGVYAIALKEKAILLIKQTAGPFSGHWDLPGGKIESGETIEETLRRELAEEVHGEFNTMALYDNFVEMPPTLSPLPTGMVLFQRIGLVYRVEGLKIKPPHPSCMEYQWIPFCETKHLSCTPFVHQLRINDE